jgi:hypothetical protein
VADRINFRGMLSHMLSTMLGRVVDTDQVRLALCHCLHHLIPAQALEACTVSALLRWLLYERARLRVETFEPLGGVAAYARDMAVPLVPAGSGARAGLPHPA